jgi:hypothetical protein
MNGRCVPYRVNKKDDDEVAGSPCSSSLGDDTGTAEVEVLMISTPNRADMVFPKVREERRQLASSAHRPLTLTCWIWIGLIIIQFGRAGGRTTRTCTRRRPARPWRRPASRASSTYVTNAFPSIPSLTALALAACPSIHTPSSLLHLTPSVH